MIQNVLSETVLQLGNFMLFLSDFGGIRLKEKYKSNLTKCNETPIVSGF